jgi:hypothetical protein
MRAACPETSRAIIKVVEEESAAFCDFDAGWLLAGGDEAGTGPSAARRTKVA